MLDEKDARDSVRLADTEGRDRVNESVSVSVSRVRDCDVDVLHEAGEVEDTDRVSGSVGDLESLLRDLVIEADTVIEAVPLFVGVPPVSDKESVSVSTVYLE
jgi:hypothetical protein